MNKLGQRIQQALIHAYVFFFARPQTQYINQILFNLASRGKGYNNYSPLLSKSGEMKLIRRLSNLNPSNFFDVGANIGQYSMAFAEITKSKVFAFEPMVGSFQVLKKNCESFGERVSSFNFALGDGNYRTTISFNGELDQLASISTEVKEIPYVGSNNINSAEVTVRTLDSIFEELSSSGQIICIDILKIDTEGFEYEVLVGASNLLKSHPLWR
jgi:FkbM family methyltransferase